MNLHPLDIGIIAVYLLATIYIGFSISKRASKNLDAYFLGGHSMPWYILGISNASGMFDITGTMWLVYVCFVYGLKSAWLPWVWPMFNQIFLMVYLAAWLRKSNVLTGAEWIQTRFGRGRGATLSHISVVIFALVSVIGFLAYAFKGIGKFAAIFLPWELSPDMYGLIFMGITSVYVILGGMYSVVFTEVLQFIIMTVASIAVGVIAMMKVSPELVEKAVPEGWANLFFGWRLDLDWSGLMDAVNSKIASDGYELFGIFFILMMFKGFLVSMAGPAPNYDMQRVLATKSPGEAGLMSGFVNVALFFPRYLMVGGLTVLAIVFFSPQLRAMGPDIDFEMILPYAIKNFVPVGLMGVMLAGLLSAFMSTFAATVNAAPAYIVNDIYKRFVNPDASSKKLVRLSYAASVLVVAVGILFGFLAESINQVTLWIVAALWGGYAASNVLKWYWWRLNGYGYFWGMISGIAASMLTPLLLPGLSAMNGFPIILTISAIGCVAGSLLTKPESDNVLKSFYSTVRPWGFWKPVLAKVLTDDPAFEKNTNFKWDMLNVLTGLVWQISLIVTPLYLILKDVRGILIGTCVIGVTTLLLKRNWYDRLERTEAV